MKNKNTLGVVVGRFQVPLLHDGHRHLINTARIESQKLLILVGSSGGWTSKSNPLDFETRKQMLLLEFPGVTVIEIFDHISNEAWSDKIDKIVDKNFRDHEVTLYGSRDSFLPYYSGRLNKRFVEPKTDAPSGTLLRKEVSETVLKSVDFRSGVIYAGTRQNFPTSFQAVDIAILNETKEMVLVGRKSGEPSWRFPGGFVNPTDSSLEMAAKREAREEVGDIEVGDLRYLASVRMNDHRYRESEHKVMTALFSAKFIFGKPKAGDDLQEVMWQNISGLVDCLMDSHKPLAAVLLNSLKNYGRKL